MMSGGLRIGLLLPGFYKVEMGLHASKMGTCSESGHKRRVGR